MQPIKLPLSAFVISSKGAPIANDRVQTKRINKIGATTDDSSLVPSFCKRVGESFMCEQLASIFIDMFLRSKSQGFFGYIAVKVTTAR